MTSFYALTSALNSAQQRLTYCRRELDRFKATVDFNDERQVRSLRKLQDDVRSAEIDVGHAQNALDHIATDAAQVFAGSER